MSEDTLKTKKKLRLLEYLRVSTLKQKNDITIETQKRENTKFKKINSDKYEIIATYKDDGKSGFKFGIEERPDFNRLLDLLYSDDSIDGIYAYDLDRIGRDSTELMILGRDFIKLKKKIVTTNKGEIKQDTPEGELIYGIFSLLTQFDGNTIKRKFKAGRERKFAENVAEGLPKTHGFGRKDKIVPKEIKDEMIKWYNKGYGFKIIQKRMKKIEFQKWDDEKKEYVKQMGYSLSPVTIGKRLREWDIVIRKPKYSKSEKEVREEIEKEVKKRTKRITEEVLKKMKEE